MPESGTREEAGQLAGERGTARNPRDWIAKAHQSENVAELLEAEELDEIGLRTVREYEIDEQSRADWKQIMEEALKLVESLMVEAEAGAANVKYPLIITAAIQFCSRALPEIIRGNDVVKAKVVGRDDKGAKSERGKRVAEHMSYQLLEEMTEWQDELDRLLIALPILGSYFRKTYYDPRLGRNVSRLCSPQEVVINYKAKSMETAPRITHLCEYYLHEVYEYVQAGTWLDQPIRHGQMNPQPDPDETEDSIAHTFLEQHKRLDLDHDGYTEPYVVTVHKDTAKVVRIVARFDEDKTEFTPDGSVVRIEPVHYFTKFAFLPNPTSAIYDWGFGILLFPLNDSVNTLLDQLIDAGTAANLQAGLIAKGVRIKGGSLVFKQREWKLVDTKDGDLRKNVFPLPVNAPSDVLFKLLGLLLEAAKDITTVKDVMTGTEPRSANVPATTTLMMVEQATKVFNGIYKRLHRALGQEFKKIFRLNGIYMNPTVYFRVLDDEKAVQRRDYLSRDLDIVPVSDPTMATDVQRVAKAQALLQISGRSGVNEDAITMRYLLAINVENPEEILPPPEKRGRPPVDPKVLEMTGKLEIASKQLSLERERFMLEQLHVMAKIEQLRAKSIEHIAKADAAIAGPQLQMFLEALRQAGAAAQARIDAIGQSLSQKALGEGSGEASTGQASEGQASVIDVVGG